MMLKHLKHIEAHSSIIVHYSYRCVWFILCRREILFKLWEIADVNC